MNLRQIGIIRTLGLALLIVMAFSISLSPSVTSEDSNEETEIVKWLVLHHLLLSKTAFRYELGDPKTIKDFAEKVKTVEKLKLLLVLTVADIKGVGPDIWNDWKGSLISDLYLKSLDVLQRKKTQKNTKNQT